jgi:hypothetical protein
VAQNRPFGLALVQGGGVYNFNAAGSLYSIPTSDSSAYYLNDIVKAAASSDALGVPNIQRAGGTDTLRGTVTGILPTYPGVSLAATALSLENTIVPATKAVAWYVLVDDDPSSIFMIQDDGVTTANLVAASANLNFSMTTAAGATSQSLSATVMTSSTLATTATLNMKAEGLAQVPNNAYGAYAVWKCRINKHELTGGVAGV